VAELTVALILSVLRRVPYADSEIKKGRWIKKQLIGTELHSKTVGIIGAGGRIGFEVARIIKQGFGAKVLGYDVIDFQSRADSIGIKVIKTVEELLAQSDIISIHVPYLPATHHFINKENIGFIKKGAILINPSRGDLFDGQVILQALKQGNISGLGLDVYHKEPPSDQWEKELITYPEGRVVCTCHIGAQTTEAQKRSTTIVIEQIIQIFQT
jgi:D-3-phosphoglycerate dehydrogenase